MNPSNIEAHIGSVEVVPPVPFSLGKGLNLLGTKFVDFNAITTGTGDFTVSFWVMIKDLTLNTQPFLFGWSAGDSFLQYRSDTQLRFRSTTNDNFNFVDPIDLNRKVYFVISRISGLVSMYKDKIASTDTYNNTYNYDFRRLGFSGNSVNGLYNEFAIKKGYGATQTDVDNLFNNKEGADFEGVVGPADIYLKCNGEGTELAVPDTSSNSNDGLIGGGVPYLAWGCWSTGESEISQERLTSPSKEVIDGMCELIENHQAALNNSWDKIDEIWAFNVDTEVNALTGWKRGLLTLNGLITHGAYDSFNYPVWNVAFIEYLVSNINISDVGNNFAINDAFLGIFLKNFRIDGETNPKYLYSVGGVGGRIDTNTRNTDTSMLDYFQNRQLAFGLPLDDTYHLKTIDGVMVTHEQNGVIVRQDVGVAAGFDDGILYIGNSSSFRDEWGYKGEMWGFSYGVFAGFDTLSHYTALRKFRDRMLMQKHITVVNNALFRYTDLTDIEVFTIGRLVANLEELGYWIKQDEFYLLGLFKLVNAIIGLIDKTGTLKNNITHIPGVGMESLIATTTRDTFDSDYNSSTDSINALVDDTYWGGIFDIDPTASALRYLWRVNNSFMFTDLRASKNYAAKIHNSTLVQQSGTVRNKGYLSSAQESGIGYLYVDGQEVFSVTSTPGNFINDTYELGGSNAGDFNLDGVIKAWHVGASTGIDKAIFNKHINHAVNELEVEKANDNNDWNIDSQTYDWSDRELLADQLEKLVTLINANCDDVTLNRELDLRNHLGITLNSQAQIDDLENNKNWIVTLI